MIKLIPVITEKSMKLAKEGKYSFLVGRNLSKAKIKEAIKNVFGVDVVNVRTLKIGSEVKRTLRGTKISKLPKKKAIVTLKQGEKIDLFEEKK